MMKFLVSLIIIFATAGCAILEQERNVTEEEVAGGTAGSLPKKFQLHDVPHNPRKQKGTDCAPDSLRIIVTYRGRKIENEQEIPRLLDVIKRGGRGQSGGTSFGQMQEIAAEHYGLPAFIIYNCDMNSLKSAIVNEWPPIVSYRSSGRAYHAVVAVGYDDKRNIMSLHDPNYLKVRKIRYDDLGGISGDAAQKLTCLLVLPEGSTEEELRRGLKKYIPAKDVENLRISPRFP